MKTCPHCQANIEDTARFCLYCMTSLDEKQYRPAPQRALRIRWQGVLAAVFAFVLALGTVLLWPEKGSALPAAPAVSAPGNTTTTGTEETTATRAGSTTAGSGEEMAGTTTHNGSTTVPTFPLPTPGTEEAEGDTVTVPTQMTAATKGSTTTTTTAKETTTTKVTTTTTAKPTTTTTTKKTATTTTAPLTAGLPRVGDRYYTTPYYGGGAYVNPYYEETTDLYIEVVDVEANGAGSGLVTISFKMCPSAEWQVGSATVLQYRLRDPNTGKEEDLTFDYKPRRKSADTVFSHKYVTVSFAEKYIWEPVCTIAFIHAY